MLGEATMDTASVSDTLTAVRATALTGHYQTIREQLNNSWEQRNRRYSLLVAMLAVAALLSFVQGPLVQALGRLSTSELATLLAKLPTLSSPDVANLVASFLVYNAAVVFDSLMIAFLVLSFYLMTDLFHRSSMLASSYVYLALVEGEIRNVLLLRDTDVAFTREGSFYNVTGFGMTRLIGGMNKGMLGLLLLLFFGSRLLNDSPQDLLPMRWPEPTDFAAWGGWARRNFLFALDVVSGLLTLVMYLGYLMVKSPSEPEVRAAIATARRPT